jgi:hypothetical protein
VVQYHYVDRERLRLANLMRLSFHRSKAGVNVHGSGTGKVPLYLWRKVGEYLFSAVFSLDGRRTRFYLVRCAAALGEIRGTKDLDGGSPNP